MYNKFRKLVFTELHARGESVHDLIEAARARDKTIGDTVRYAENIVKMFDEVAVQAVENYQATVAADENVKVTKEEDNVERGKENTQRSKTVHRRRDSSDETESERDKRTRSDRSGIQENAGGKEGEIQNIQRQKVRLGNKRFCFCRTHIIQLLIFQQQMTVTRQYV